MATNKVAIITGGGTGIGRAAALHLQADGWDVAVVGRRKTELDATVALAKAGGGRMLAIPADVTKQADVIMGLVLLDEFHDPELIGANLDYYGPRTDHGSSLSLAMHSVAASLAGRPGQAYEYFRRAAAIDLEDSMLNSSHGVHAATQGGLLQAALVGFAGLRLGPEGPETRPRRPEHWEALGFSFVHGGTRHEWEALAGKPARGTTAPRADHDGGG